MGESYMNMVVFELKSSEKSLILWSEMLSPKWYRKLGRSAIESSILNRTRSKYYKFILSG